MTPDEIDCVVIGGGQAGLSAGHFLQRFGLDGRFVILDHAPAPGGAWQFRWPTLTLAGANHVHDLPGWGLTEALGTECDAWPAASAVADYFRRYEERFDLPVRRPVHVRSVRRADAETFEVAAVSADGPCVLRTRTVVNATGTWDRPFIPHVPGIDTFAGRQLHTHDYQDPHDFDGERVLIVGAGISAVQLLIEIARTAEDVTTFWCSRREPEFSDAPFTPEGGREAVSRVERRVRAGLPPTSVVSVTGLFRTPAIAAAQTDGILEWMPMMDSVTESGVSWTDPDRPDLAVDTIFWNTGFRSALDHLAPLRLRAPGGGITMTGRLATVVADEPRIQLLGYGPSASTIGANRAGREAARVVVDLLSNS
ncbi:NAD(P)-binding domain-containing protein [Williamsia deligens]|uniref:NAD(P)-binding domain-containing protein n=1 Tax=Williamsia deligens TaxID=321325 RepID=A0ABW3GCC8_9NOCA|nr:NAD(P)-binding domain-containing protein [Williamsia deligens]MCP2192779.1 Pyridine nucleotide-disulfide oxidoreductase [Williamsia deligens]